MRSVLAMAMLFLACGVAQAQKSRDWLNAMLGTISVTADPFFVAGELKGCQIVYSALIQDWKYSRGGPLRVTGSFGLMGDKRAIGTYLKVVLEDVDPNTLEFKPNAPASAYFVSGNTTTKNESVITLDASDTPGAIMIAMPIAPALNVVMEGLKKDKVTIAFARTRGGADIVLALDTSVADTSPSGQRTHSRKATLDFADCATTLLDKMK